MDKPKALLKRRTDMLKKLRAFIATLPEADDEHDEPKNYDEVNRLIHTTLPEIFDLAASAVPGGGSALRLHANRFRNLPDIVDERGYQKTRRSVSEGRRAVEEIQKRLPKLVRVKGRLQYDKPLNRAFDPNISFVLSCARAAVVYTFSVLPETRAVEDQLRQARKFTEEIRKKRERAR